MADPDFDAALDAMFPDLTVGELAASLKSLAQIKRVEMTELQTQLEMERAARLRLEKLVATFAGQVDARLASQARALDRLENAYLRSKPQ